MIVSHLLAQERSLEHNRLACAGWLDASFQHPISVSANVRIAHSKTRVLETANEAHHWGRAMSGLQVMQYDVIHQTVLLGATVLDAVLIVTKSLARLFNLLTFCSGLHRLQYVHRNHIPMFTEQKSHPNSPTLGTYEAIGCMQLHVLIKQLLAGRRP